jgi:hypothetical protein
VEYFIAEVLTAAEKKRMLAHLRGYIAYFDGDPDVLSDAQVMKQYLDLCRYRGVTSPEFQQLMGRKLGGSESPEEAKQFAIRDFVRHAISLIKGRRRRGPISIGFSDDDRKNVESVQEFIHHELAREFPGVKFVIYDTSDARRAARPQDGDSGGVRDDLGACRISGGRSAGHAGITELDEGSRRGPEREPGHAYAGGRQSRPYPGRAGGVAPAPGRVAAGRTG